jgi:hypothetical protein
MNSAYSKFYIPDNSDVKTRLHEDEIRRKVKNYPHFCFSNLFTQK